MIYMKPEELEWLKSVESEHDKISIMITHEFSAISTNGIRLHAISPEELPAPLVPDVVKEILELEDEDSAEFLINSRFLVDALKIFDDVIKVEVVTKGDYRGIRIIGNNKVAIVSCSYVEKSDRECEKDD